MISTMVRIAPPPMPWTERPPIAIAIDCAAPVKALPSAKMIKPPSMTGRLPKMLAKPPAANLGVSTGLTSLKGWEGTHSMARKRSRSERKRNRSKSSRRC
mgnify:CR=1 FL=1|jgi:hypothetical protein